MAGIGARGRGEANAPKSTRNGGVEGENRADRGIAGVPTNSGELSRARGDSPSAVEREHATRKDEVELLAVAERKEEAGAGREGSSKSSATMARGGAAAAARGRAKGESVSGGAQMAAEAEADAAGRSWWPTGARPGCRMLGTRRPSSAGAPRRHGAAVRARARRGPGEGGERERARLASASGPEVRPRPASAPLSLFHFFLISFLKHFLNSFGLF